MEARHLDPRLGLFPDEPAPLDESRWLGLAPHQARGVAAGLPLTTRFRLGERITPVQQAFLDLHGFAVFAGVATPEEVETLIAEADRISDHLIDTGTQTVNGLPVWMGVDPDGKPYLQRLAFTSLFSEFIRDLVTDDRFEPVRTLVGDGARIGHSEKDGVVLNRYVNCEGSLRPGLAWHTDGLRDIFYNWRMPDAQLNVGLHFERIRPQDGGLRLIPGSHDQGLFSTLFRKIHFVSNDADPDEVAVETWPGDLTVHDGRMWHRVEASPHTGWASRRHSMYVPYLTDAFQPKDADSPTPPYMRVFDLVMRAKRRLNRLRGRGRA